MWPRPIPLRPSPSLLTRATRINRHPSPWTSPQLRKPRLVRTFIYMPARRRDKILQLLKYAAVGSTGAILLSTWGTIKLYFRNAKAYFRGQLPVEAPPPSLTSDSGLPSSATEEIGMVEAVKRLASGERGEEKERRIIYPEAVPEGDRREGKGDAINFYTNQVANSRARPGLYLWGSNTGLVADPSHPAEAAVKKPRRVPYFDGMVLRDVKLSGDFGAAVTEQGDVVEWGRSFVPDGMPAVVLKGKGIKKVEVSLDRIIALGGDGSVYSIPVAKEDQIEGLRISAAAAAAGDPAKAAGWSFWGKDREEGKSYRVLKPQMEWGENVVDISSGLDHCLLLTSKGRVFSAASNTQSYPSKGQLGVPGLTWETRPEGKAYDEPHLVALPSGARIKQVATGDYHSVALNKAGQVYVFGDNGLGQLGMPVEVGESIVETPLMLEGLKGKVESVAAGGANTMFISFNPSFNQDTGKKGYVSEILAAGTGISGSLGSGTRPHMTAEPVAVKTLSGMTQWDERKGKIVPVRPTRLSVGSSYACAVLDAVGGDVCPVYVWGGNGSYELGTGKRRNMDEPGQMVPLEGGASEGLGQSYFAAVPRGKGVIGEGKEKRKMVVEQRVEFGRNVSGVYMGI